MRPKRTRDYPMQICEEIFLDKNISLEAKAIIGILNTFESEKQDIDKFLSTFKIDNIKKFIDELKINNYLFTYIDNWSNANSETEIIAACGLKYSIEDKKDVIFKAVIDYIELQENNNQMKYQDEEKEKIIEKALSTFIEALTPNKT